MPHRSLAGLLRCLSLLTAALLVATALPAAHADEPETIRVGVFTPQQVFENYTGREQMMQTMQELQQQAQQAMQAGEQQAAMQAQQQMQQVQSRTMEHFRAAVETAAEQLAEERDLHLVVLELSFEGDHVESQDLTEPLIEAINAAFEADPPDLGPAEAGPTEALAQAALQGDAEEVQAILDEHEDIDINAPGRQGATPLMLAAYNGHTDVIALLLEHGAEADAVDPNGRSALMYASTGAFTEAVELLLEQEPDVDRQDDVEGFTALMFAATEGNADVARLLLDAGADPTLKDNDDETALDFAQQNDHAETVEVLENAAQ